MPQPGARPYSPCAHQAAAGRLCLPAEPRRNVIRWPRLRLPQSAANTSPGKSELKEFAGSRKNFKKFFRRTWSGTEDRTKGRICEADLGAAKREMQAYANSGAVYTVNYTKCNLRTRRSLIKLRPRRYLKAPQLDRRSLVPKPNAC